MHLYRKHMVTIYHENLKDIIHGINMVHRNMCIAWMYVHSKKWLDLRRIRDAVFNICLCYIRKITYMNPVFISVYAMYGRS